VARELVAICSVSLIQVRIDGALVSVPIGMPVSRTGCSKTSKGAVTMSADTTITCRDCGQAFTFTSGEQDFYASRGFSEPNRCADCRAARKAQRDGGEYGSSSSYGGAREMFSATCSSCGNVAQVPFQPSGDKPVYCSSCFQQRGGANRSGGYGRSR
jgi:CxxC-x17-CxxC domain-containing protein